VLAVGDKVPNVAVWTGPNERHPIREFHADRPALFLFYLFDWSST
jgi:hypothetical protein